MKDLADKPYYNSMDTGDYYAYGFFGGIFDATVKNVHFTDVNIDRPGGSDDKTATQNNTVGAAVGAALGSSTIENVTGSPQRHRRLPHRGHRGLHRRQQGEYGQQRC